MKVSEIAELTDGIVVGNGDKEINGVSSIEHAGEGDLTFLANRKYLRFVRDSRAGCILVNCSIDTSDYPGKTFIVTKDPYLSFARVLNSMFKLPQGDGTVSERSVVSGEATLGEDVSVGDFAVIERGAVVGRRTVIMPFVYVGEDVCIGEDCILYPHVVIKPRVIMGNRVIIHAGSVIGSDGFGYAKDENGVYLKIPQIGNVIIEDDVEIGANVSIDRAALDSTVIRKGTKIDNLVQVGHNVEIGENSIVISQSGISGSTKIGRNVVLAGQSGIAGHLKITDDVIITAKSGVGTSIRKPGIYGGIPAHEHSKWLKNASVLTRLYNLYRRVAELEQIIGELKGDDNRRD